MPVVRGAELLELSHRLDRSIRFRFNNRYLEPEPIAPLPKREPRPKPAAKTRAQDHRATSAAARAPSPRARSSLAAPLAPEPSPTLYASGFAAADFDSLGSGGLIINL